MSRTKTHRPYSVLFAETKGRENAYHDHARIDSTRTKRVPVIDEAGKPVMIKVAYIKSYTSTQYLKLADMPKVEDISHVDSHLSPRKHNKAVFMQTLYAHSAVLDEFIEMNALALTHGAGRHSSGNIFNEFTRSYGTYYYTIHVRCVEEIPLTTTVEERIYKETECTIDYPRNAGNNWGWDLPCHYSGDVYRTGNTSPYARNRKHREARRNRYIGRTEAKTAIKAYNSNYEEENFLDESNMLNSTTNHVSRKRWDWD